MKKRLHTFLRFKRDETGAALVEFGMVVPLMLIFAAVVIESGRLFWTYQSANAGVRDAARMVARIAPKDICPSGSVAGYDALVTQIVEKSVSGTSVVPNGASIIDVVPILHCPSDELPFVEVSARVQIRYIWSGFFGADLDTLVSNEHRIYGV